MKKRLVVLDIPGLSLSHFKDPERAPALCALARKGRLEKIKEVFPALTLPAQASLTTGKLPQIHGVVANGFYHPNEHKVAFWEQSAGLVGSERVWDRLREKKPEIKTATLFLQNTLYANCDSIITPKPLHSESGLIPWCYSKPPGLYEALREEMGEFDLRHYWGPLASIESTRWIASSAIRVMKERRPELMFVYLPHLDYCSQRFGPDDPRTTDELASLDREIGRIAEGIREALPNEEPSFMVVSEYTFSEVRGAVALNNILRKAGLFKVREIRGREYPDLELSPAFAMADHQIAHIYVKPGYIGAAREILRDTNGIDLLIEGDIKKTYNIDHPRSGDLIAVSKPGSWFSYYWWDDPEKAPDFASRVDIHRKPGYDPLELFFEPGTRRISHDTSLIKGSHGRPWNEGGVLPLVLYGEAFSKKEVAGDMTLAGAGRLIEDFFG